MNFACDLRWEGEIEDFILRNHPSANFAKSIRNLERAPDHSPGLRRKGATPGKRICFKVSPERAAQTTAIADFAQPFPGCHLQVSLPGVGAKRANPGLCYEALSGLSPTEIRRSGTFCRAIILPSLTGLCLGIIVLCRIMQGLTRRGRSKTVRSPLFRPVRYTRKSRKGRPIVARQVSAGLGQDQPKSHRDGRTK